MTHNTAHVHVNVLFTIVRNPQAMTSSKQSYTDTHNTTHWGARSPRIYTTTLNTCGRSMIAFKMPQPCCHVTP